MPQIRPGTPVGGAANFGQPYDLASGQSIDLPTQNQILRDWWSFWSQATVTAADQSTSYFTAAPAPSGIGGNLVSGNQMSALQWFEIMAIGIAFDFTITGDDLIDIMNKGSFVLAVSEIPRTKFLIQDLPGAAGPTASVTTAADMNISGLASSLYLMPLDIPIWLRPSQPFTAITTWQPAVTAAGGPYLSWCKLFGHYYRAALS